MVEETAMNTDRELWRETEGDYYASSIHVTAGGSICINVGGRMICQTLAKWHAFAASVAYRENHPAPLDLDARERLAREFHLVDEPVGETMSLSWDDLLEGTQERYLAYADCAIAAALAERPVVDREELVELEAYADDRTAQAFSKMHAMRKCNDTDLADAFERERDAYSDMTMRLRAILALLQPGVVSATSVRQSIVTAIAFLNRDNGTERLEATVREVVAELVKADAIFRGQPGAVSVERGEDIDDLWDEILGMDDRTSPEEYPNHALITYDEFKEFCLRASLNRDREG